MKTRRAVLLFCLPVLAPCAVAVAAAPGPPSAGATRVAGSALSLDQAVKLVEQRFQARVVKAETQQEGGRTVYVLRLLSDSGKVWTVRVDASSGAVL